MFWMGACEMFRTLKCSTVSDKKILDRRPLLGLKNPAINPTTTLTVSNPCSEQISDDSTFNVLQCNANEIRNKLTELGLVLERNKVKVAVIQESKLSSKSKNPCIRNYTTLRNNRPHDHAEVYSSSFMNRCPPGRTYHTGGYWEYKVDHFQHLHPSRHLLQ